MREKIVHIGFDLDNTLFKPNARINEYIRSYACRQASELLGQSYEQVRSAFDEQFALLKSFRGSLRAVGIEDATPIVQEALEQEEIVSLLQKDEALNAMLVRLSVRYGLFLITTNTEKVALRKLQALGIDADLFDPKIYELENPLYIRRDGSAFHRVSQLQSIDLSQMLFVGDRESTDILPAKQLGMMTAIVNAKSSQADYQLEDIYQLEEILK